MKKREKRVYTRRPRPAFTVRLETAEMDDSTARERVVELLQRLLEK